MVIGSLSGLMTVKRRPKTYKARDAAYSVGGNRGFYLAGLPRPYPRTPQQRKVANVAAECGIHKGITKSALQQAMASCVGPKMRK